MQIEDAIVGILQREGAAFTNDAQDQPTKWGVTLNAYREFKPAANLEDIEALDVDAARAFYRWRFQRYAALDVDARVWTNIVDADTLHGPAGAVKAMQAALGVTVDGQLGPKTIAALHATPASAFCLAFADARVSICVDDVRRDLVQHYGDGALEATDLKYLHGWIRRIIHVGFACLLLATLQACSGAARGATVNNPFHRAEPIAVPQTATAVPYDGHVRHVGSWLDARRETAGFTNLITIRIDCDDPHALNDAHVLANGDPRDIVLFSSQLGWGNEGYQERADAARCWQLERNFIAAYRPRIVALWIVDEPWDTAWSYWINGVYQPNRYNAAIASIAARMRADEPTLLIALNVGSLPDDLVIPDGITLVGIEAYSNDWETKLLRVERLTPAPIWLMPRAFTDARDATDAEAAARLRDQYAYAQTDPRITGLYWFLFCCDDTTTGNKSFYTVSGPQLPQTKAVLVDVARAIVGGVR